MGLILCATRGGEASYRTQQAAIELAKASGDEIVFLYVIDLSFLNKTAAPIVVDVENEVDQMGDFFLLMAKELAAEHGVEARVITRKGSVRAEIKNAAQDEGATLVVLGRPTGKQSKFQISSLRSFADEIETETGVKVMIV
jgi:nucleotide-binding universal stress UspA family protein